MLASMGRRATFMGFDDTAFTTNGYGMVLDRAFATHGKLWTSYNF